MTSEVWKRPLAVVVPAYKPDFLREALAGFANPPPGSLKVYVFDDCSPHPLESIVRQSLQGVDYAFLRFERNLGGTDLAAHWNRCISLTEEEPWIWLFSDDDRVEPATVAAVLRAISVANPRNLLALNLEIIDQEGTPTGEYFVPPRCESALDFALARLNGVRQLCAADHVFSRSSFRAAAGFCRLPKAWYSDEITWHRMVAISGGRILRVENATLQFRLSGLNISTVRVHDKDKQASLTAAWRYWRDYLDEHQIDAELELAKWRRNGLLASGLNPLSRRAFQQLRDMGRTRFAALLDQVVCAYLKLRVVVRNRVRSAKVGHLRRRAQASR